MEQKKAMEIAVKTIKLVIGKKEIDLTPQELQTLQFRLMRMFGDTECSCHNHPCAEWRNKENVK